MSDTTDIVGKLGTRLSQKQTYKVVIMLILLATTLSFVSLYRQNSLIKDIKYSNNEVVKSINNLAYMVEINNKNKLTESEAISIYECTFSNSMNEITRMAMLSISHNHISDSTRQRQLRTNYGVSIQNLYDKDYEKLDRFTCNGNKLSNVMDLIHPMQVRDNVLILMFNEGRTHAERRRDIERYCYNQAITFTELAKKHLR